VQDDDVGDLWSRTDDRMSRICRNAQNRLDSPSMSAITMPSKLENMQSSLIYPLDVQVKLESIGRKLIGSKYIDPSHRPKLTVTSVS
jgi:hypothetical protein